MLTGADGSMTPLESATTKLLGVAVAMGARLVPIGAMRHVAGVWPGPAFLRLAQGPTICENTPVSGLPTVIDNRFAGFNRAHEVGLAHAFVLVAVFAVAVVVKVSRSPRLVPFTSIKKLVAGSQVQRSCRKSGQHVETLQPGTGNI